MSSIAFKILKAAWPYLLAALIAGAIVGWIEELRMDNVKAALTVKEEKLATCQDANTTMQTAVSHLMAERDNAMKGCETRIRLKETTLANIRRIDSIEVKRGDVNGKDSPDSGDPLLGLLNGMFPPSERDGQD